MAATIARLLATVGSRLSKGCTDRSRLKATTSTTKPVPPTARKEPTSGVQGRRAGSAVRARAGRSGDLTGGPYAQRGDGSMNSRKGPDVAAAPSPGEGP